MTTPMMQQWREAKRLHRDGILFFRMGDFYEFFHEDAKRAAELLGLTLTARSKGDDSIPMAGIPVKSAEGYVRKLVARGEKVVICEQVEDPAEAKGIVQREVTRIVTPGTITETEALDDFDHNYLVAACTDELQAGLAWVDLSTGHFFVKEVEAHRLADEIVALEAAECLFPESLWLEGPRVEELTRRIDVPVTTRADFQFDRKSGERELTRHFKTLGLEGFGVESGEIAIGAAGALLGYLEETQRGAIGQVRRIRKITGSEGMILDRATRSSLELTRTLREGERRGSLLGGLDRTVTAMGARKLKQWILSPLLAVDAIHRRQDAVAEFFDEDGLLDEVREHLKSVLDLERLAGRVGCGRAHPRDLAALRQSLSRLPSLSQCLREARSSLLAEAASDMPDLEALRDLLDRALVDEPPLAVTEGGILRDEFHEELAELRRLGREGKGFIASFQAREAEATGIPNLKIGYNRVFGYYIEVTNSHRDSVPETYTRKQTLKNAERYVTAELKEYEDKVLHAEERAKRLEHEIFLSLRAEAEAALDSIQASAEIVALVDVLQSFARTARDDAWIRPEVDEGFAIRVEEGRHPVIARASRDEPFVPNDLDLDEARRVMLITGPNMAGKSTYIRQVALISILAQIGSFVPARRAHIGVVDRVFTRVGASDDLAGGSSTFMVEMLEVANILHNASERSLVILDEVGRGTSTFDGLSLAWAITEHLAAKLRAKTLFATHYHELTAIADALPQVANYNVAVREWGDEIVFLHRIVEGGTDKSYGIHVARLAGLPEGVLEDARRILASLELRETRSEVEVASAPPEEQLDLFAPTIDPLRERVAALDLENTTPLEALALLDRLRREARGEA
jgi:DNA mismatch repair protein MutS